MSPTDKTPNEGNQFPFYVTGKVIKGFGRGSSELGIPTANIEAEVVKSIPFSTGIYFGWSQLSISHEEFNQLTKDQQNNLETVLTANGSNLVSPVYMISASLGYNPYYDNKEKALEIHILHQFNCDLYGLTLKTLICGKIREEANFDKLEELIKAIHKDIDETQKQLSSNYWLSFKTYDKYFTNF